MHIWNFQYALAYLLTDSYAVADGNMISSSIFVRKVNGTVYIETQQINYLIWEPEQAWGQKQFICEIGLYISHSVYFENNGWKFILIFSSMLELSEHVLFSSRLAGLYAYVQIIYLTLFC